MMLSLLTDTGDVIGLRAEWQALWHSIPDASPFFAPEWLMGWWTEFGTGAPRVATLRHDGRLLGVLPLYVLSEDGCRKILPMGIGISDDLGPLIAPGAPADAAALLLAKALEGVEAIGACDLTDIPPASPLRAVAPPPGWVGDWRQANPRPVLALPGAVEDLRSVVPANTLRKLRMNRNRAARIGGYTVACATPDQAGEHFATLVRLHSARWQATGESGVLADPRVLRFHRAVLPQLISTGAARICVLQMQGKAAAAIYALLTGHSRILFYLSGYDAGFAHESPGTLLLGAMIEQAVQEGRREADFLRGAEAYKYAWGARDRWNGAWHFRPDQMAANRRLPAATENVS